MCRHSTVAVAIMTWRDYGYTNQSTRSVGAVRRLGKLPKCAVKAIALCAVAAGAQVLLRWSGRINNIDAVYLACQCIL